MLFTIKTQRHQVSQRFKSARSLGVLGALVVFLLTLSSPTHARDTILDIKEVTSPGGITAWLAEDHSVPVIAMRFAFRDAGSAGDPADKQGLAQLASNTMDEGAGELDAQSFQKELRDLVTTLSFSSGRDYFQGTLKTLTKNKERSLELLKLSLTAPRFDQDAVDRMIRANQTRIRSSLSDPEWLAARIMNDRAFEGHPYALNSGGTLQSLATITPEDLRAFHASRIGRNNLVISVAGDITAEELGAILDDIFGSLPEVQPPQTPDLALQNKGTIAVYKKDIPQTIIEMLQPGIDINAPDYIAAKVMNYILGRGGFGSRLMEEIREKRGLTYGIYSHMSHMDHIDTLGVSTSTDNKNAGEMLALIKEQWRAMRDAPVSQEELDSAKSYLIGSVPLSLTSTDSIAGVMLSLQLDNRPTDYLDIRAKEIEALTADDILRVAQRLLDPAGFTTVLVGAPEGIAESEMTIIEDIPNAD